MNAALSRGKKSTQGAKQSRTGFSDRFRSYWAHHKTSFSSSLFRLLATPLQTLMTALVVAIALALPAILLVAMDNVEKLGDSWDADPKITIYLNPRARENAISLLSSKLEERAEIKEVSYVSADQALEEFQSFSGFGEALSALDDNPLPASLIISLNDPKIVPEQLQQLTTDISEEAIVDELSLDMDWVRRLQELMLFGKKLVTALAVLLGIGVLVAIGNTIRLAIESRRDEILVVKLVGGTNGFVRRPFLYAGGWYGFMGGVLACFIVLACGIFLDSTVANIAFLYESHFSLRGLSLDDAALLLFLSTFLGWFGAWAAVGRHLSQIEPE